MKFETMAFTTPKPFDFSGLTADEQLAVIGLTERDRVELNSIRIKEKLSPSECNAGFVVI